MRKIRSNAMWNGLSAQEREILERWLFEEQLGYDQALERARSEFGFEGSVSSVRRFYHRMAELRMARDLAPDEDGASEEESLRAGMRALGRLFAQQVTENPTAVKEWRDMARLLLQSEANRLAEERSDIWRGGLALAREKYEFDAAEAALKQLENREDLDAEELAREKARIQAIRERLYGRKLTQEEIERAHPK